MKRFVACYISRRHAAVVPFPLMPPFVLAWAMRLDDAMRVVFLQPKLPWTIACCIHISYIYIIYIYVFNIIYILLYCRWKKSRRSPVDWLVVYPRILQGFVHPRLCRISSINSIMLHIMFFGSIVTKPLISQEMVVEGNPNGIVLQNNLGPEPGLEICETVDHMIPRRFEGL